MNEPSDTMAPRLMEPQYITDPVQIAGILRRLQDAHALLRVSLPGGNDTWLSAILEVQPAKTSLTIDELSPRDGNSALQRTGRVVITAQIQGVDISFATDVLETGSSDGLLFHRIALPPGLRYWQRRASFRAQVGAAMQVGVSLRHPDGLVLNGELADISAGGIGTRFKDSKGVVPLLGEVWKECHILLPQAQEILCAVEVRYVGQDPRTGRLRLGGRFVEITRSQLKAVETFVAHLEREQLRKLRRTRS
jgi:c-di-GMP-binding flagellar brake protein YcgR